MSSLKSCGVLVMRGNPVEAFLLMRHADRWDLPKGHVDDGETEMECALRELAEETGIAAADIALDPAFRYETQYYVQYKRTGAKRQLKSLVVFLARLLRDVDIRLTEHLGYEWFPWSPPHNIQEMSINPLLREVEAYVASKP
jgi:8-oxo-dGTP pyrophosphatase MutT (NUDIX family)